MSAIVRRVPGIVWSGRVAPLRSGSTAATAAVAVALVLLVLGLAQPRAVAAQAAPPQPRPLVLSQAGPVRATIVASETACADGDFGIEVPGPGPRLLIANYFSNANQYADTEPLPAGQSLVFSIQPQAPCSAARVRSDAPDTANTPRAHVFPLATAAELAATKCAAQPGAQPAGDAWCIEWEDKGVDDDFNDAVVRIERLGPGGGLDVPGAQAFLPVINGDLSADPVNLLNGSYVYTRTDLALPGRGPSPVFARAYNSADPRASGLGPGWTHSYGMRLGAAADGSGALVLLGPRGRTDRYTRQPDGTFVPPPGVLTTLTRQPDGTYTATHPDQSTWSFDAGGRLSALTDRYGNRSTLRYNTSGQLTAVDDPAGRGALAFGYYPTSRLLASVTDWAGRVVRYGYDAQGRLQTVTDREN